MEPDYELPKWGGWVGLGVSLLILFAIITLA
jgi:hypothetical protein